MQTLLTLFINHVLKFLYQPSHLKVNIQLPMYVRGV